ncbi:hypothetical protein [Amycolatopsis benzoatilytica]|uniref:hypothetical protein n=1 Tax=Amycolatopsis benzoatilytica TaxID=346045 RepID=UPI000380096B|nr:hypothetical protein [Amycolatopsis benzoatilytica]
MSDIDGDTDAMREFSKALLGSLDLNPVLPSIHRDRTTPCQGGLGTPWCDDLTAADNASMEALHLFLTQVEEGFKLYSSFVHQTARAYTAADELARNEFLARLDSAHGDDSVIDPKFGR